MHSLVRFSLVLLCVLTASSLRAETALKIPPLFGTNACVQAGRPIAIWGWNAAGEKVEIKLGESSATATAGPDGRWTAEIPAIKAGGPYTLVVKDAKTEVKSDNIVAGEVWLASGQSNMFLPLARTTDGEKVIAAADHPTIRLFRTEVKPTNDPATELTGEWLVSSPQTVRDFSGVAYYFGLKLNEELKTPVGMIESSLGGTPIQAWLPLDIWKENASLTRIHDETIKRADGHAQKRYDALKKRNPKMPPVDLTVVDQNDPSVCFNAGIAPLYPYTLAGFLWYQGEWNTGTASDYPELLARLITKWRELWNEGDLPFYVVQLPPVGKEFYSSVEVKSSWAALREAQLSALKLPNTGIVVTMDVGGELHPPTKKPVGDRLAGLALAHTYGKKIVADSPMFAEAKADGAKLRVKFTSGEGLVIKPAADGTGFFISGADKKFFPADAVVDGDTIVLTSKNVAQPTQVRYLWSNNPIATVFNGAGLPASPFRSDNWEDFAVVQPAHKKSAPAAETEN